MTTATTSASAIAPTTAQTLDAWMAFLADFKGEINDEMLAYLSRTNVTRLSHRIARLQKLRGLATTKGLTKERRGRLTRLVGLAFEHVIRGLLTDCRALKYDCNVHSTTGEIDFLMRVEPMGIKLVPFLHGIATHVLGEAKCYTSAPKKEWIDEFAGILPTHGTTLGFLFVASKSGTLHSNVRFAVALHAARNLFIVPFGFTQLAKIQSGASFLRVLQDQVTDARTHTTKLTV